MARLRSYRRHRRLSNLETALSCILASVLPVPVHPFQITLPRRLVSLPNPIAPFITTTTGSIIQREPPPPRTSSIIRTDAADHPLLKMKDDNDDDATTPEWCPINNIYLNGVVPSSSTQTETYVSTILSSLPTPSPLPLKIFGYGSLCWNPGSSDDTLSKTKEGVETELGRAVGWRRCWAQKSADHRGTPGFLGLVCTLLSDEEVEGIEAEKRRNGTKRSRKEAVAVVEAVVEEGGSGVASMTEGLIYTVPPHLVEDCLAELDFREKGGYSRDVIDVIEDATGTVVKALLYRGTPDNPAFSTRALLDPPFAAATISIAVGPSGKNAEYLLRLDTFLSSTTTPAHTSSSSPSSGGDTLTRHLASLVRRYRLRHHLYFLFGAGSNQHDQLLLRSPATAGDGCNAPDLFHGDEAHDLKEVLLVVPRAAEDDGGGGGEEGKRAFERPPEPVGLYAGGGHSGLLTECGDLYLWGWNGMGQLGRSDDCGTEDTADPDGGVSGAAASEPVVVEPLADIRVETAALGHGHTLLIERGTRFLYAFGDDRRGQVSGRTPPAAGTEGTDVTRPTVPPSLAGIRVLHAAAGLFHSAAVTEAGELVTFGEHKYGQCLANGGDIGTITRWRPDDGSRLVAVSCGRRHTIVLDEHGRVWSLGSDDKHGQLGRRLHGPDAEGGTEGRRTPVPVDGVLGRKGSGCVGIDCGWSHNVATVRRPGGGIEVYGWGRNDRAQLGAVLDGNAVVDAPRLLHTEVGGKPIADVRCGGESIMASNIDGEIYGCGWNEHGNLSTGNADDVREFTEIEGAHKICSPPPHDDKLIKKNIMMATGGAHFLAMQSTS